MPLSSNFDLYVYITHFYDTKSTEADNADKQRYLAELIFGLARLDVNKLQIKVFTNLNDTERLLQLFDPMASRLSESSWQVIKISKTDLFISGEFNPWALTWSHKKWLKEDIEAAHTKSVFLYLENDALFLQDNLDYFLKYRNVLSSIGLIPGYIRAEYSKVHYAWANPDLLPSLGFTDFKHEFSQDSVLHFRQYANPFSASIILDNDLGVEYIKSESFDMYKAGGKHRIIWDSGSTAALGLVAERVPPMFTSRTAVVLNDNYKLPLLGSILRHQGDRYAQDPWQFHGRLFYKSGDYFFPKPKRSFQDKLRRAKQIGLKSILQLIVQRYL